MKRNTLKEMQAVASGEYGLGWEGKGNVLFCLVLLFYFFQLWTHITFGTHSEKSKAGNQNFIGNPQVQWLEFYIKLK